MFFWGAVPQPHHPFLSSRVHRRSYSDTLWEAEVTPVTSFIAWALFFGLCCSRLGLFVHDGSPFHNVCTRDVIHLPGVIGVAEVAVPAGWPLRSVEGAVRVGATWFVEEKLEGVGLTPPKMGNKRNKVSGQRLATCWRLLACWDGQCARDLLRRFGLLHPLCSLVVFARGCWCFSHLWSRRARQMHCNCPHTLPSSSVLKAPVQELCTGDQKSSKLNKPGELGECQPALLTARAVTVQYKC